MGGGKNAWLMLNGSIRWRWCVGSFGVFSLGGLGEMELLMEEVVDGGGVHAVQMIDQCFD